MGWQESRVTLVPENTELHIEVANFEKRKNIPEIISFQNNAELEHSLNSVYEWLKAKGFQLSGEVGNNSLILERNDVQFKLHAINKKLAEITATFTLSREAPSHWDSWRDLVTELCARFDLVLVNVEECMKTEPQSLIQVLSNTRSWQELKGPYNWPEFER